MTAYLRRPGGPHQHKSTLLSRPWIAYGLLSLVLIAALAWPTVRAHLQAVAILLQLEDQPVPIALSGVSGHSFEMRDVSLENGSNRVAARMYLPAGEPNAPGIVVVHGVQRLGMDEPRLVALATALATAGYRVLTPQLSGIENYEVTPEAIDEIGAAAHSMALAVGRPVGVIGLSFSGGLSLMAAARPQYANDIRWVMAVGAHDSMERVAEFYRQGKSPRADGSIETLMPHEYGALILEYDYLPDLAPGEEADRLRPALRAHLYEDRGAEADAVAALNDADRSDAKRLMDTTTTEAQSRLETLIRAHAAEMAAVSPADRLAGLKADVYLVHGEGDTVIPASELSWLAREIPAKYLKSSLVTRVLSHVSFEGRPSLRERWALLHLLARVLEEASRN